MRGKIVPKYAHTTCPCIYTRCINTLSVSVITVLTDLSNIDYQWFVYFKHLHPRDETNQSKVDGTMGKQLQLTADSKEHEFQKNGTKVKI